MTPPNSLTVTAQSLWTRSRRWNGGLRPNYHSSFPFSSTTQPNPRTCLILHGLHPRCIVQHAAMNNTRIDHFIFLASPIPSEQPGSESLLCLLQTIPPSSPFTGKSHMVRTLLLPTEGTQPIFSNSSHVQIAPRSYTPSSQCRASIANSSYSEEEFRSAMIVSTFSTQSGVKLRRGFSPLFLSAAP